MFVQLPKRKSNRLKHYDYSQNGAYFITVCVKDGRELLGKVVGGDDHSTPMFFYQNTVWLRINTFAE